MQTKKLHQDISSASDVYGRGRSRARDNFNMGLYLYCKNKEFCLSQNCPGWISAATRYRPWRKSPANVRRLPKDLHICKRGQIVSYSLENQELAHMVCYLTRNKCGFIHIAAVNVHNKKGESGSCNYCMEMEALQKNTYLWLTDISNTWIFRNSVHDIILAWLAALGFTLLQSNQHYSFAFIYAVLPSCKEPWSKKEWKKEWITGIRKKKKLSQKKE